MNVGCIPSKALLKNAELAHTLRERAKEFGISFDNLNLDYAAAVKRSRKVSQRLTRGISFLMKKNNIDVYMGTAHISSINGSEAWQKLKDIAARAETNGLPVKDYIQAVLTDVEMPEMDGYVLTKHIKNDPRFAGIPVIMHSSLSAEANMSLGKGVGADAYVPKFEPKELSNKLVDILTHNKPSLEDKS